MISLAGLVLAAALYLSVMTAVGRLAPGIGPFARAAATLAACMAAIALAAAVASCSAAQAVW